MHTIEAGARKALAVTAQTAAKFMRLGAMRKKIATVASNGRMSAVLKPPFPRRKSRPTMASETGKAPEHCENWDCPICWENAKDMAKEEETPLQEFVRRVRIQGASEKVKEGFQEAAQVLPEP